MGKKTKAQAATTQDEHKAAINTQQYHDAVAILNTQKNPVFDDSITIKDYLKLLSGYALDKKRAPRLIECSYPLDPGVTLIAPVKEKLIAYVIKRINKEALTRNDQLNLLQWACLSGSDDLVENIVERGLKNVRETPVEYEIQASPFTILCDNSGFSSELLYRFIPLKNELDTVTIGICSERSPIYLFLKAHNSPDQLGKDEDFWLQMVANLHTQSLELRYDLQALTEFYAALNYLLPNFSETHYPNTKAVMQKNLDLIRSYLIQDRHSDELMSIIFADAFLLHLTKETALFKSETFKKLAESLVAHAGERLDSITLHNIFSIYPEKVINYLQSHTSVIESLDPVFMSILINHKNSAPLLEKMIPLQTVYQNEVYMVDSIRSLKNQGYSVQNMKTCIDQIKADDMRCKFMQAFINDYGHAICKPIFMPTVHELLATPGLTKELMLTFISWVNPDDYEQLPWDALSIKKIDAIKIEYPLLKELTDDALAARKAKQPFATYRADKKAAEEAKIKAEQCAKQTQLLEQQKANEAREAAKQLALQQQKNKQKQLKIEEEEQRQAYLLEKKQEAAAQSARDKAATPVGKIQRITSPETTPAQSSASDRPESGYASKPITTPELPTADNDESLEMQLERVKKVVPALIASLHHRNAETERHYHAAATEIARLSQELEQRPVMPIFFPVAVPMPVPVVMVPLVPVEYHPTIFAERRRRQRHRKPCPEAHSTHKADEPTHDEKQSTLPGLGANGNTSN